MEHNSSCLATGGRARREGEGGWWEREGSGGFKNESGLVGYCSVFRVRIGSHSSSHQLDSDGADQTSSDPFLQLALIES